jgi:alcohol dehydrogenase, propanol-preferring
VVAPHPRYLVKIGTLDPALAATFACSGITVYGAIRKAMPLAPDDAIVLVGAGGLGHAAIAMLRAFDHRNIVCVDVDERKRAAALAVGSTVVVDGARTDAAAAINAAAGGPVRAVIDFVNTSATAEMGLQTLTKGGKLILVGVAGGELTLSLAGMIFRALTVQASLTGSLKDLREVVQLAQSGKLKPSPIVRMPKSEANAALIKLKNGDVVGRAVLVDEARH